MRKWLFGLAVVGVAFLGPLAQAQDVQSIIDKAIKAHGGQEKIAKFKDMAASSKAKGKLEILGGVAVTLESYVQFPDKLKSIVQFEINGMNITTIQVYDGKKFHLNVNGQDLSNLIDDKALEEIKEQLYQDRIGAMVFFKDKPKDAELSPLGETKFNDRTLVGIRVSTKGHRDVSLWFDKETGLLTKVEGRTIDFQSKEEKSQEKILSDYKEVDGLMRPTKVLINQDDKKFMEVEILEVKIVDKFDDSVFAKP